MMIKRVSKTLLPAILITTGTLAGCTAAAGGAATGQSAPGKATTGTASAATVADDTGATHIAIWSVNSDGPDFQAILTGGVGDHRPGVTVHPDGSVDPDHTSELELKPPSSRSSS